MAKGVTIQISGLKELQKKLKSLPQDLVNDIDATMAFAANDYVNRAVGSVPVDQGILKNGITQKKIADMNYEVVSAAEYSAYMEWGTRSRVQVPSDLQAYAAQFKGGGTKGGDVKQMIFDWCKRKGIEKEYWFPIFIKIMRVGVNPHPFFFKHREPIRQQLNKDLQQAVKSRISK